MICISQNLDKYNINSNLHCNLIKNRLYYLITYSKELFNYDKTFYFNAYFIKKKKILNYNSEYQTECLKKISLFVVCNLLWSIKLYYIFEGILTKWIKKIPLFYVCLTLKNFSLNLRKNSIML